MVRRIAHLTAAITGAVLEPQSLARTMGLWPDRMMSLIKGDRCTSDQ